MAREGISFEQVAAAADALTAEGLQPTIRAVRERLGTGSPNTIQGHIAKWRDGRTAEKASALQLPETLLAAIAAEIERAATKARAEMQEKVDQAIGDAAELARTGKQLEAHIEVMEAQIAELKSERDTMKGKAEQQAAEIALLRKQIEDEIKKATTAETRAAVAEARLTDARASAEAMIQELKERIAKAERKDAQPRQREATQASVTSRNA